MLTISSTRPALLAPPLSGNFTAEAVAFPNTAIWDLKPPLPLRGGAAMPVAPAELSSGVTSSVSLCVCPDWAQETGVV